MIGPRSEGAPEGRSWSPVRSSSDAIAAVAIPTERIAKAIKAVKILNRSRSTLSILAATTEEILKRAALSLAVVLLALPVAAGAQSLFVGIVRDQDGAVVGGARLVGRDAAGRQLAAAAAAADGTFALAAAGIVTVDVDCDYCLAQRGLSAAATSPLVILVTRFRALALDVPNDRDLSALPYARAENAAALQPFTFSAVPGNLSFGLDRGHALVSTAGVAFYRISDGGNALTTLPDRYLERLTTTRPDQGYRYGNYADGGTFDVDPASGERTAARLDGGPDESIAARYATPGLAAAVGASYGSGTRQARADLIGTSSLLGGTLRTVASLAGNANESYSALGAQYATSSRRFDTYVDANVARSTFRPNAFGEDDGSSLYMDVRVRSRGPLALEGGARFRSSAGYYAAQAFQIQMTGLQQEAALYTDLTYSSAGNTLQAAAGVERIYRNQGPFGAASSIEPVASFQYGYALGAHFGLTASGSALPRIPTLTEVAGYGMIERSLIPVDRDRLVEAGLSYTDRSRIQARVEAFRQEIEGGVTSTAVGVGASLGWQIAPALSLRSWIMQPSQNLAGATFYSAPVPSQTTSVWLTYDAHVRIDAIYYGGRIDGDVNLPVGPDMTFRIGRDASSGSPRYSFGLRFVR